jgi:hypothetical protein
VGLALTLVAGRVARSYLVTTRARNRAHAAGTGGIGASPFAPAPAELFRRDTVDFEGAEGKWDRSMPSSGVQGDRLSNNRALRAPVPTAVPEGEEAVQREQQGELWQGE